MAGVTYRSRADCSPLPRDPGAGGSRRVLLPRTRKQEHAMSSTDSGRVELPLAFAANAKTVITACTAQSGVIKECPAYATTPAGVTIVTEMDTAVGALQGTVSKIDQLHAQLATLITTRTAQIATVH